MDPHSLPATRHADLSPAWLGHWAELFVSHIEEYAIFALDLGGTLLTWQPGVAQVMGYSRETFVGRSANIFFTESDRRIGALERELDTARSAGQALDERWHLRADGSRFWASGIMLALRDDDGNVVGFSKIVRDRTALRLRQESRALQTLRLEGDVATRTQLVRALASDLALAEQRERERVSQLLHDDLQQQLYALQMLAHDALAQSTGAATVENGPRENLREIYELAKLGLATTRTLVSELNPAVLKTGGLGAALPWLAEHMYERHGLSVALTGVQSCPELTGALGIVLFQCIRELLFNVVKHARIGRAGINVRAQPERLQLEVWDEGQGFGLEAESFASGDGFGLMSVKRRLEPFSGAVLLASVPGAGTRITLEVPLL